MVLARFLHIRALVIALATCLMRVCGMAGLASGGRL